MKDQEILAILKASIGADPIDWKSIMAAFPAGKIKNWLKVRGVLQWMLDQGMIRRISNLQREEYQKI